MRRRESLTTLSVGGALVLALTSLAWACSGSPSISFTGGATSTRSAYGPAGSRVTIQGSQFGGGPVELRWNSVAGKYMGEGVGPSFSVTVNVPGDAPPGVHYILAVQYKANSTTITGQARAAYEVVRQGDPENYVATEAEEEPEGGTDYVTASGATRRSTGSGRNRASTGGGTARTGAIQDSAETDESEGEPAGVAPVTEPATDDSTGDGVTYATATGRDGVGSQRPVRDQAAVEDRTSNKPAGISSPSEVVPASSNPRAVVEGGTRVFGGSLATPRVRQAPQPAPGTPSSFIPSLAKAPSDDLFSGFDGGQGEMIPSLVGPSGNAGPATGPAAGLLMLSAGLTTLLGGTLVATLRRRRMPVVTRSGE